MEADQIDQTAAARTTAEASPLIGWSLIAGEPTGGDPEGSGSGRHGGAFHAREASTGAEIPTPFHAATPDDVDRAATLAWEAFHTSRAVPGADRATLLDSIAANIDDLGDALLKLASRETGLPEPRLAGERDRTTLTLRMFAQLIRAGSWVRAYIDRADPGRRPTPKPDLRRMLRPLGPVAVFGASNFPLAYSTAGSDTASALAAGCPVVVKGHPLHPGTGKLVAVAVAEAVRASGLHPGTFSFLHAGGQRERDIGAELVRHRCIRAVGFTGSFGAGTALEDIARSRPDRIPVYAEMGSTNPVFVLPGALSAQGGPIAERLADSVAASVGQMCTCPGLIFVPDGEETERFIGALGDRLARSEPLPMLAERVHERFYERLQELAMTDGVQLAAGTMRPGEALNVTPVVLRAGLRTFTARPGLHEEVFGPAAIVVTCDGEEQMIDGAAAVTGSLTGSIFAGSADAATVARLQQILELRVGRLIFNGVPTGVDVAGAMVHGGPFPATNQPHTSAVGPTAIERWCRPVCYQNAPARLLPPELRDENPLGIRRTVDGRSTDAPL